MMADDQVVLQNFLRRTNQRMDLDLIQTFLYGLAVFVFCYVMNAENRHG